MSKYQKNEISRRNEISKRKMKSQKKTKKQKISELNQCQCQTMSVSDNIRIQLLSDSHNVRV